MDSTARRRWLARCGRALAVSTLTGLLACGAADPPFEELPLRDALTADPEVLAALSDRARQSLAERFEEARRGAAAGEPVAGDDDAPEDLVRAMDEERAARGDDALVAVTVRERTGAREVEPLSVEVRGDAPATLPPLAGGADAPTADLEARALHGRAGGVLGELLRASGAKRLVRVTAWPVGAAASGDAVYVNAAWLVALSPAGGDAGTAAPVALRPLSVGGNPYLTYGSLAACAADVGQRCTACLGSGPCDAHPTLQDFADEHAECAFLAGDPSRPLQLCALALLSIGAVGECVRSADPACSLPSAAATSASLPEAATFVGDAACVEALDTCLSGSSSPAPDAGAATQTIAEPTCQDPFSSCASAFKGMDDACKSGSCTGTGNQSCTSCSSCKSTEGSSGCNGSGGSSSSSCSSCNSGGGGSSSSSGSSTCKCQTPAAPGAPLGAVAWLLAPLGFALRRARRPS